ncbi:MAG TPA: hypothetical protein VJ770_13910 [Stellaceae bacterium]|nr:hypothetical protein [Stellaceae bacterium]
MDILPEDIQQGNGFRVRVNINQEGPGDRQLRAFGTHSGESMGR